MLQQFYKWLRTLWFVTVGIDILLMIVNSPPVRGMAIAVDYSNPSNYVLYFVFRLLDLTTESNLAVWYSSSLLLLTGLTAVINSRLIPAGSSRMRRLAHSAGWLLVAALLFMLSGDEVAQVHENLVNLRDQMNRVTRPSADIGAWIPLLAPFIVTCAVGLLVFMVTVFWKHRAALLLGAAGLLLWVSAVGLESVETGLIRARMAADLRGFLEESCEIVGTTLLLGAFLWYLYASLKELNKQQHPTEDPLPEGA
jgi:hypothetical protein